MREISRGCRLSLFNCDCAQIRKLFFFYRPRKKTQRWGDVSMNEKLPGSLKTTISFSTAKLVNVLRQTNSLAAKIEKLLRQLNRFWKAFSIEAWISQNHLSSIFAVDVKMMSAYPKCFSFSLSVGDISVRFPTNLPSRLVFERWSSNVS